MKIRSVGRRVFVLLVLVGLVAVVIVWRATRDPLDEVGVARAGQSADDEPAERPSTEQQRSGGVRESRAPLLDPAPSLATEDTDPPVAGASAARARFVDESGRPIAGVELSAPGTSSVARSGVDGVAGLELDAVLAGGAPRAFVFQARHEGHARDQRRATKVPGEGLLLGDWRLASGGRIEGTVVDPDGRGLARVQVACLDDELDDLDWERDRLGSLGSLWRPAALTETAADGAFVLEEAPAGRIRLVAVTDDRPAGRSDFIVLPAGGTASGIEIRMEAPDGGTTIAGIVLDPGGAAVAYAPVSITGGGTSHGISTDDEGRFRVRLNDKKPRDVTAKDPEGRHREASRRGVKPGTKDLVLQLAQAPEIELTVRTPDGKAVGRFAVATIAEEDAEVLAFSSEDDRPRGLAVLSAPGQDFRVEVRANGYLPARLGPYLAKSPPAELACTLDLAGGVHGVVLAEGQPLAGATVALYRPVETEVTCNGFPLRTQTSPANETESGEQGAFSLSVEEAGAYYLRAEAEGFALAEIGPLQLAPTSQREERIELGTGGTLEVCVRSTEGASVAGKIVAISRGDGRARTERTDDLGLVVFSRLTPGGWQVVLSQEEIRPGEVLTVQEDQPAREVPANCRVFAGETTRVDLWLEDDATGDCRLTGRLVLDGKPAEGWLASLSEERAELAEATAFVEPGAFRLAADEPGSYHLNLRTDTTDPSAMLAIFDSVELYEGTRYWSLELETGTLEGTLDAGAGESSLVLYRWDRGTLQCFTPLVPGEGGRFRCRVPAGRGVLVRGDPSIPMEEQTPVVLRELVVEAGKTTSVDL